MLKIGIVGFGKMGQIRADVLESVADVEISSVYEPGTCKCKYERVPDPFAIFLDDKIDAVFICTPNKFNKEYAIAALNNGKHVFCEKPPAFTASEVMEVMEAEKKSGKKIMYGFNHRHHGSIIRAKEVVDSGEFGKILWMRGRYGKRITEDQASGWRMNRSESGGGILLDQGIHMLDLLMHFGGDFDIVQAIVSNLYWNLDIEDNAFVNLLNTKTGVAASLHSTMTEWRFLFSLEIFLESGYIVINGLKTPSKSYGEEKLTIGKNIATPPAVEFDLQHTIYENDRSWNVEMDHFLDAIRNDTPIISGSSADAFRVMSTIDEIYKNGIR
jgi:predicted dehydrogenase